jgi:hypothetical protein
MVLTGPHLGADDSSTGVVKTRRELSPSLTAEPENDPTSFLCFARLGDRSITEPRSGPPPALFDFSSRSARKPRRPPRRSMSVSSYPKALSFQFPPTDRRKPFCLVADSSLGGSGPPVPPTGACLSSAPVLIPRAGGGPAPGRGRWNCFLIVILILIIILFGRVDYDYD